MNTIRTALLLAALALAQTARAQTITPIAGGGSNATGPALTVGLSGVSDLAVAPDGSIYFVSSQRLGIIDIAGSVSYVAGTGNASGPGSLPGNRDIRGVAVSDSGRVVVSVGTDVRVHEFTPPAGFTPIAGNGTAGYSGDGGPGTTARLSGPRGLAFDPAGNLYIAEANRVRKLTPAGIISTAATSSFGSFSGQISVSNVAVDAGGTIYTSVPTFPTSLWKSNVSGGFDRITEGGILSVCLASSGVREQSVAGPPRVGPDGLVYIANNTCISRITANGRMTRLAGDAQPGDTPTTRPLSDARFTGVNALGWDAAGNLYVNGGGNGRIWRLSGVPATVDSPPVANAGPDQTVVQADEVLLDGRASSDPEQDAIDFSWRFTQRPDASLAALRNAESATPGFTADAAGTFVVELRASNGGGNSTDTVSIQVQTLAEFADVALGEALRSISQSPDEAWRANGLRIALGNQIEQALIAALAQDWTTAAHKLDLALTRLDGCVSRGQPDGNGQGADWIVDCGYQSDPYFHLWSVRRRIMP